MLTNVFFEISWARNRINGRVPAKSSGMTKCRTSNPRWAKPCIIDHQVAHLPMHLTKRFANHLGVVGGAGQLPGHLRIIELDIRHINVDDSLQEPKGLHAIIPAGVVDQGNVQTTGNGDFRGPRQSAAPRAKA